MKKRMFLMLLALGLLWAMAAGMEEGYENLGRQQLEEALRRTAVSCYAAEGFYPPTVDYMKQHYGLRYDEGAYIVHYDIFASNLMPDITVLEVGP